MIDSTESAANSPSPIKIISTEKVPSLPPVETLEEVLSQLMARVKELETNIPAIDIFYYPLVALCFNLLKTSLVKINLLPPNERVTLIQAWLFVCLISVGQILEKIIEVLSREDELLDQALVAYIESYRNDPFQWNEITLTWIAQWLTEVLDPRNHQGSPPFFAYIPQSKIDQFSQHLPRIFEGETWLTGFGNRFLVPAGALRLGAEQKALLWNYLLVSENIYDDQSLDHRVRQQVFEALLPFFPEQVTRHLDLCGGRGDFIEWLRMNRPGVQSLLVDNADAAISQAQTRGINARLGNAEKPLLVEEPVQIVTIIFALQWLSPEALENVLMVLEPGGICVGNTYPANLNTTLQTVRYFEDAGFDEVTYQEVKLADSKVQFIVSAKKPLQPKKPVKRRRLILSSK